VTPNTCDGDHTCSREQMNHFSALAGIERAFGRPCPGSTERRGALQECSSGLSSHDRASAGQSLAPQAVLQRRGVTLVGPHTLQEAPSPALRRAALGRTSPPDSNNTMSQQPTDVLKERTPPARCTDVRPLACGLMVRSDPCEPLAL
jgi:hypothetical protein